MEPRVVTGLGICSAIGIGRDAFFRALETPVLLRDKTSQPIESFDASKYEGAAVAEVRDFDPAKYLGDKGLRTLDRLTKLLVVATRIGTTDAGLKKDNAFVPPATPDRVGVVCSNAYGSLEAITELNRVATLEDARYINPAKFPNTVANSASGYASIWEELRALNVAVSDGNCGALDAVGCADVHFASGRADALLVGGAEAASEALYVAFHRLGMLEAGAALGEGAALLALERKAFADKRGARALAEVVGFGTAFEAPDSDTQMIFASTLAMTRAIRSCLEDASLEPSAIDLVASGLSGLKPFDTVELAAINEVLGKDACIAMPKALVGETLGAGGAMAMACALGWLQGIAPAAVISGKTPAKVKTVLVTTMGYYGNASAVILRASDRT
ncbi:MAG TPA: beta-ketoacyl synthase N-terminal-like domain-containing protein [Polyangiaceae bacterium]|nr:beta-ketoacyl synthase N-terminal-like domain-containing protein [Polyangiaceae bacterium]